MKTLYLILLSGIVAFSSCDKETQSNADTNPTPKLGENFKFYQSSELYKEGQASRNESYSETFEIDKVERTGNLLDIIISYENNCKTNNFDIVWDGILLESWPMQTNLNVRRTPSDCNLETKTVKDTLSVDLVEFIGDEVLVEGTIFYVSNLSKISNETNANTTIMLESNYFDIDKYPQKWALVKMTGQIPNSDKTGENMEWQEYYLLKSNGAFIKHRERDGINYDASGNFSFVDKTDGKFLELIYDKNNEIIGSCYANQTESLWLKSNNKLVGTWSYCDGPGLEYERKE